MRISAKLVPDTGQFSNARANRKRQHRAFQHAVPHMAAGAQLVAASPQL
jgi:hypothetical protein